MFAGPKKWTQVARVRGKLNAVNNYTNIINDGGILKYVCLISCIAACFTEKVKCMNKTYEWEKKRKSLERQMTAALQSTYYSLEIY